MAKTQEELNTIKEEVETLNKKLVELNDEELKQVTGGVMPVIYASVIRNLMGSGVAYNSDSNNWKSDKLPTEPGNYKIGTDIELNEKWIPDTVKVTLDK